MDRDKSIYIITWVSTITAVLSALTAFVFLIISFNQAESYGLLSFFKWFIPCIGFGVLAGLSLMVSVRPEFFIGKENRGE